MLWICKLLIFPNSKNIGVKMKEWYKEMFEGNLAKYWLSLSDSRKEVTNMQVSFLSDIIKNGLVLDHCCGSGRLSIPLSTYLSVVGLDLSGYLLRTAKKRAEQANIKDLFLVRADMRYLPFKPGVFDNVINIFTSFGYFSDEENETVLEEIAGVLKTNGVFALDMANPEWLVRNFREKDWTEDENYISLEQRSVDWKNKRWKSRWVVINKQTKEIDEISFDHRLYSSQELEELLSKEGIETTQVYGSYRKESFNETKSNRIIILSKKL